jgi:hypothetical protein
MLLMPMASTGGRINAHTVPVCLLSHHRLFLSPYDLTPTYKDVNNKFSVRYFLNLVLVDEEDRRYFKQQEITLYRKDENAPPQQQQQSQPQPQLAQAQSSQLEQQSQQPEQQQQPAAAVQAVPEEAAPVAAPVQPPPQQQQEQELRGPIFADELPLQPPEASATTAAADAS